MHWKLLCIRAAPIQYLPAPPIAVGKNPTNVPSTLPDLPGEDLRQNMPVAMPLLFGAMTQQRDMPAAAEPLQQPQCKFLSAVFYPLVRAVEAAAVE
jgi:hypothetical protein